MVLIIAGHGVLITKNPSSFSATDSPFSSKISIIKPGSGTFPFPGLIMDILDENGESVAENEEGFLVIKTPWPAMIRTIYKDPDKYVSQYWSKFPGVYLTGDSARRDKDGYYWIIGRVDDVIKVSGYRLG